MDNTFSDRNSLEFDVGGDQQDQLFDVLSHPRRRFVLDTLLTVETPVEMRTLATELVEWEASAPDRSDNDREAVEISLVHNHLPRMAAADFIEYDATERTITLADRTDEVRAHLQTMKNQRRR